MNLEEELNQIYKSSSDNKKSLPSMMRVCAAKLDWSSEHALKSSLIQVDASWRTFCKSHIEYTEECFHAFFTHAVGSSTRLMTQIIVSQSWGIHE